MPAYDIYFLYNECEREHPINLRIHLNVCPERKNTSCSVSSNTSIAPQLMTIRSRKVFCLKTSSIFKL